MSAAIEATAIEQAVKTYLDRDARRTHPAGKQDSGGRWYPSPDEERACCGGVRSPSRSWPWSLMLHCRTITHIAHLHGVDERALRVAIRAAQRSQSPRQSTRLGGDEFYKAVALRPDGRLVSLYDGETEYVLGVEMRQATRQNHGGGYYVYQRWQDAASADVRPRNQETLTLPWVVLRMRCAGSYCRYDGKIAFSRVTPVEVMGEVVRLEREYDAQGERVDAWPEGREPSPGRIAYSFYGHPLLGLAPVAAEVGRAVATP